jgi:hypothetical protein
MEGWSDRRGEIWKGALRRCGQAQAPRPEGSRWGLKTRSGFFRVRPQFETPHHEVQQLAPAGKVDVKAQGSDMFEERPASGEPLAQHPVGFIEPAQGRMHQEGQEVQGGQDRCQVLLAVTEIVFEVVTLGYGTRAWR